MGTTASHAQSGSGAAGPLPPQEEASIPTAPGALRAATHSLRVRLAARLRSLDRSTGFHFTAGSAGLFDFQEAACRWLQERMPGTETTDFSLLEMAAGCGKTRAVGAFLQRSLPSDALCLYITQGGLVRQTLREIQRVVDPTLCRKAETSREFEGAVSAATACIAVVNVAIPKAWMPWLSAAWCVVIDEAHRVTAPFLGRVAAKRGRSRGILLLSATPTGGGGLATLAMAASEVQHFVLLKGAEMAVALNMPSVGLRGDPVPLGAENAEEAHIKLLEILHYGGGSPLSPLLILLAAGAKEGSGGGVLWALAVKAWETLSAERFGPPERGDALRSALIRRLQHPALRAAAEALCAFSETKGGHALGLRHLILTTAPLPASGGRHRRREVCGCCGLQEEEVQLLRLAQERAFPVADCPLPEEWDLGPSPFARVVLRLPSAERVAEYRARVNAGAPSAVRFHWLSSDLSAAQRASRVRIFARPRESPLALAIILRAGLGTGAAGVVSSIGGGALLRNIVAHLADQSLLVCDARCGDVGYNLQFCTHVLAPTLPRSVEEVHQLAGRAERITSGSRGGRVQLVCRPRAATGEVFVLAHLQSKLRESASARAAVAPPGESTPT